MSHAVSVIKHIDWAWEAIALSPVIAIRLANKGADVREFVQAVEMTQAGVGGYDVPRDSAHIRRRAKANRTRNRAAKQARKANR